MPVVVDEEEDDDGFFNRKKTVSSGSVQHSLDAEGAFDTIPHVVIFGKLDGIVPDYAWHVMYASYRQMYDTMITLSISAVHFR